MLYGNLFALVNSMPESTAALDLASNRQLQAGYGRILTVIRSEDGEWNHRNIMQDEEQRKQFIQKTFNTVAQDYGLGASRFFHLSGEVMAELLGLDGDESVLDVASGTGATALPWQESFHRDRSPLWTSLLPCSSKRACQQRSRDLVISSFRLTT